MGTRHIIIAIIDNEVKLAQYGQWDGYLDGQGKDIVNFLLTKDLSKFKENLRKCDWASKSFFDVYFKDPNNITQEENNDFNKAHPQFSRDTGSEVLDLILNNDNGLKLQNNFDFVKDSLFCEYAYLLDLDKDILEIYKGYNKKSLTEKDRFFYLQDNKEDYSPVKIFAKLNFNNLKEEFDKLINEK